MRHRCDYCGRFYSSPLPDGNGCREHEHLGAVERSVSIRRHNAKIVNARPVASGWSWFANYERQFPATGEAAERAARRGE